MKLESALIFVTALFAASAQAAALSGADASANVPRSEYEGLWKRKGGGGSGGKGGSSGGSSSGSSSGSSGGSSSRSGLGSSTSNVGGSTRTGSGASRSFGGGNYYGGGARTPYKSGIRSPAGIAPFFLAGAFLAFWPGIWLYGAHMYPYHHPYSYYNRTAAENQTRNVLCGCDPHLPCGCDDNNDTALIQDLVGDGTNYNRSIVSLANVNGTDTLLLNGTLPNGTTAPGGTDEANAGSGMRTLVEALGFWPMVAAACAAVFLV